MSTYEHTAPDCNDRPGVAAVAMTASRRRGETARSLAGGLRHLEALLAPTVATVWLWALLALVTG
jgi:hypothetical protein